MNRELNRVNSGPGVNSARTLIKKIEDLGWSDAGDDILHTERLQRMSGGLAKLRRPERSKLGRAFIDPLRAWQIRRCA